MSLVRFRARNHPQQQASDRVDDRGTDPVLFAELHRRFRFTVDVAASEANAKLPRFYTRETDGLRHSWAGERVWCNPPYSQIYGWVYKAWQEAGAPLVVMLLPANRTEQGWWQDLVEPSLRQRSGVLRCEFLAGRQRFVMPGRTSIGPNERPPFGCCLLIWERAV